MIFRRIKRLCLPLSLLNRARFSTATHRLHSTRRHNENKEIMNLKIFLPLSAIFILTISRVSCEHKHIWIGTNSFVSFNYFRFLRSVEMTVYPIHHLEMETRCPRPFSASAIYSIKFARIFRIFVTYCRQCYLFRTRTI